MTRSRFAVVAAVLLLAVSTGAIAASSSAQPVTSMETKALHPHSGSLEPGQAAALQAQSENCSFPVEVTDATGETVTVGEEPERVVALGASVAQTMWAIDAKAKVVGLPTGYTTAYLNGSQNRTNVLGAEQKAIVENIIDLEPDVVLAANIIDDEDVETLRDNGLTVVHFERANSIEDVTAKTRLTGALVGACDRRRYEGEPAQRLEAFASTGTVHEVDLAFETRDGERVLDLACGYGPVGVYAASVADCSVVLTDDCARATACARRTLTASGVKGKVVTADCARSVAGQFDRILSNPPTHRLSQRIPTGTATTPTADRRATPRVTMIRTTPRDRTSRSRRPANRSRPATSSRRCTGSTGPAGVANCR